MAIGMIEFQGTIQRTQDYSAMKHNEDMKANVDQANYQLQSVKKEDQSSWNLSPAYVMLKLCCL